MSDHSITPPVIYKEIPGYPDYRVGDDGSVWSRKWNRSTWRQLRGHVDLLGYVQLALCAAGKKPRLFRAHTLVLTAFVGPPPAGHEACHGDGNPANNRLSNLRWDTRLGNIDDARRHGRIPLGSSKPLAKLTEAQVREMRRLHAAGEMGIKRLSRRFGVSFSVVQRALYRQTWRHVD